jgi:hypothetical protein
MTLCNELDNISSQSLIDLRYTLDELAAHAVEDPSAISPVHLGVSVTNLSEDITDISSSMSSANISQSEGIGPPLEFLQAAFPGVSVQILQDIIRNSPKYDGCIDMEAIVEEILSRELKASVRENYMNEGPASSLPELREIAIERKKKGRKKKTSNVAERIVIGDVLHRQMVPVKKGQVIQERVDPWSQLASLAEYLSTILPAPAETFLSLFHSPQHATAFQAICAYIDTLQGYQISETDLDSKLSLLIEILAVESEQQLQLDWARRCLRATQGKIAEALDLYRVLEEVERSAPIIHQGSSSTLDEKINTFTPKSPTTKSKGRPETTVHADHIPKYRGSGSVAIRPSSSLNDVAMHRAVEQEWRDKRAEALRKASQHWQRSQNGYGRQIAAFYAEEANKYLQQGRKAAIEAARALVIQNRSVDELLYLTRPENVHRERGQAMGFHQAQNVVDLHGMTRDEALFIARETLSTRSSGPDGEKVT